MLNLIVSNTGPEFVGVGGPAERWCPLFLLAFLRLPVSFVLQAFIDENCGGYCSRELCAARFHFGVKQLPHRRQTLHWGNAEHGGKPPATRFTWCPLNGARCGARCGARRGARCGAR